MFLVFLGFVQEELLDCRELTEGCWLSSPGLSNVWCSCGLADAGSRSLSAGFSVSLVVGLS